MKLWASALLSLGGSYVSGVIFALICMPVGQSEVSGDYIIVFIWEAIFTFTVGAAIFLPVHFNVPKDRLFWRSWICVPIGALSGWAALLILVTPLAMHMFYGGSAAITGGTAFLYANLLPKPAK